MAYQTKDLHKEDSCSNKFDLTRHKYKTNKKLKKKTNDIITKRSNLRMLLKVSGSGTLVVDNTTLSSTKKFTVDTHPDGSLHVKFKNSRNNICVGNVAAGHIGTIIRGNVVFSGNIDMTGDDIIINGMSMNQEDDQNNEDVVNTYTCVKHIDSIVISDQAKIEYKRGPLVDKFTALGQSSVCIHPSQMGEEMQITSSDQSKVKIKKNSIKKLSITASDQSTIKLDQVYVEDLAITSSDQSEVTGKIVKKARHE